MAEEQPTTGGSGPAPSASAPGECATGARYPLTAAHVWVLSATILTLAGWGMSAVGALSASGYALVILALLAAFAAWWRTQNGSSPCLRRGPGWTDWRRRFRRPLPRLFLIAAGLVFLGAILHPPNNYDATQYRLPRVLNWLAEGRWHWIHTSNPALNSHVTGTEWLLAPWLALTRTDRWVFLINWAGFLLLPGLVYSTFTRLGVRRIVAWHWMWLLPSGYNYLLQAGGSANDILGAVHALAGMHFALRARETRRARDAWFAILAAALLSGSKLSNLPLGLPIALALLPALPRLVWPGNHCGGHFCLRRPLATLAVCAAGLGASVVPIAVLNHLHCGDWTGAANERYEVAGHLASSDPAQNSVYSFVIKDPLVGISGNALILAADNLLPPVFPMAGWWNARVLNTLPPGYRAKVLENFEPDVFRLRELPGEEKAGLGFGVTWMLAGSFILALLRKNAGPRPWGAGRKPWLVLLAPYVSLVVFMTRSGITAASRILGPYYALLAAPLLLGRAQERLVRNRWWTRLAIAVYLVAFAAMAVAPERPLWPAGAVLGRLERSRPNNPVIKRAATVYEVYANRRDAFAPLREFLPPNLRVVGMLNARNEGSVSLWRPFGTRRVRQFLLSDSPEQLREWGIEYVVARDFGPPFASWLERTRGEIVGTRPLQLLAGQEPIVWHVVRLPR